MAKRSSGQFERHENDLYDTPFEPVLPLLPWLRRHRVQTFAEPCFGNGYLAQHLRRLGFDCGFQCDIRQGPQGDALAQHDFGDVDAIITNPPWTRSILHAMIAHFMVFAPTWLLFEADWAQTLQSKHFLRHCTHVVSVGRVRWIEGSDQDGKDNAAWYRFTARHNAGPRFYNQRPGKRALGDAYSRVRFTAADDRDLLAMLADGRGLKSIARALGRQRSSVQRRIQVLGISRRPELRIAA